MFKMTQEEIDAGYTKEEARQIRAYEIKYGPAGTGTSENAEPVETLTHREIMKLTEE